MIKDISATVQDNPNEGKPEIEIRDVSETVAQEGIQKWINRTNNEVVYVKGDPIIDGENMYMMTTSGKAIEMEYFANNFIQMSDEEYNPQQFAEQEQQQGYGQHDIPLQQSYSLDQPLNSKQSFQGNTQQQHTAYSQAHPQSNPKEDLIKKILKKNPPTYEVSIRWDVPPVNELNMLMEYFDVTLDDIKQAIHKNIEIDYTKLDDSLKMMLLNEYQES